MSEKVLFDRKEFREMHPEAATASDAALNSFFLMAENFCDNSENALVSDLAERKILLYLLVCHIANLNARGAGTVGILTGATQGKVSTTFAAPTDVNWYKQTQCGWMYWRMTQKYRRGGKYYAFRNC